MFQADAEQLKDKQMFIKNLKYLIKKNKTKHVDLAKKIHMTRSTISNYLAGASSPKWETLDVIADHFGVTADDLRKKDLSKNKLVEPQKPTSYQASIFLPKLSGRASLFHSDNLEGEITSPFPFSKGANSVCYAVNIGNESISSLGVTKKSLAIFKRDEKAESGDLVAVYFKGDEKILIRQVTITKHEYVFSFDKGETVVPKKDAKQTFKMLGKVVKVMINL